MKTILTTLLICTSILRAEDESSNYLNFIIQTQNDENRTQQLLNNIVPTGNDIAPKGVIGSSVFTLWTIHRAELTEYLLDEKTVSSYHPEATINITTKDPYQAIPRTRVDHPFTVNYTVNGIVTNDESVQDAAKSVLFQHEVISYDETSYVEDSASDISATQSDIVHNGSKSVTHMPSVISTDLTLARGTETFTISTRPDYKAPSSRLARAQVQIWPIAQASITGIDTEKLYMNLPNIHFEFKDLYPDSTTYVRVYEGKPRSNPEDPHIINTSYIIIDDVKPDNRNFTMSGKSTGITQAGMYTVEVIHETPFGVDILTQLYPLGKKANIKVVGNLNTSE